MPGRRSGAVKFREREYIWVMAVSSPDLKAFLVATPFFGGLSDASLDLLISMLVERRFDVGVTVIARRTGALNVYCSLRRARGEQARGVGSRASHDRSRAW